MKKFYRIIAMTLILALLAFAPAMLVACNADIDIEADVNVNKESQEGTEEMKETEAQTEKPTEKPDNSGNNNNNNNNNNEDKEGTITVNLASDYDKVKTLGRVSYSDKGIICDHSASGIEFTGKMTGAVYVNMVTSGVKSGCTTTYFTVYIDGERQAIRFSVEPGSESLKIANFTGEPAEHTIRLVKQTESNYTLCELRSIKFEGEIMDPPADNDLYIEFIGDSLTCGMGNIGQNGDDKPQTPIWEDASQSYGYMVANDLGADYSIVSESGIGIAGSWFDPLFPFYTKASYSRTKMMPSYTDDHAFFLRTPDVVVINLGTNDYFVHNDKDPNMSKPEDVERMTGEFIELVRDSYGENMPIVWVHGFVGTFLLDRITAAINKLGGEDAGIYITSVTKNTDGAQGHPTVEGHRKAADEVIAFMNSKGLLPETEPEPEPEPEAMTAKTLALADNADKVRHLGRTEVLSTGIAIDHSASGIEFKGTFVDTVKVKIKSTSAHSPYDKNNSSTYFTVYVDGVRQATRFEAPEGTSTMTVARFLSAGEHTIKIVKQTENNYTLCDFIELSFTGSLSEVPAERDLYIEVVGDSLSCGVGNIPNPDGSYPSGGGSAQRSKYEDATQTYGYLTAEALNADVSIIAEAAMGITKSWFDPMPDFYKMSSYNRSATKAYDFASARVPDIVIINQGTNDASFKVDVNEFKQDIKDFILFVREAYGKDMPIVWVSNVTSINQTYVNAIHEALNELKAAGETEIYICTVTANNKGGEGHPTIAGHELNATEIVKFIRDNGIVS